MSIKLFLCVFGFLTQKQVKIDQKEKHSKQENKTNKKFSKHARMITKKAAKQSHNI